MRDRLRQRLGPDVPDFEEQPGLLTVDEWAAVSAADFWDDKGLNALADAGDFERIPQRINDGLNGQVDRPAGVGGWRRISAARESNAAYLQPDAPSFWLNPAFWVSAGFLLMPLMILVDMLLVHRRSTTTRYASRS